MPLTLAHLTLSQPFSRRYRPAPPADDPIAREARRRAWRDRDAGMLAKDWPREERDAWKDDHKAFIALSGEYGVARRPDRLNAPAAWYDEIVVLAAGALITALTPTAGGWRSHLLIALVVLAARRPVTAFEFAARQRSARRLGLTVANAPRLAWPSVAFVHLVAGAVYWLARGARRTPVPPKLPWTIWLAIRLVSEFSERRSWRRAYRG